MGSANDAVTAMAGLLTVVIGGYTAWTGYRSRGRDQDMSREAASYDNLQEDLRNCRGDVDAARARADRYQEMWDGSEQKRLEEMGRYRESAAADGAHLQSARDLAWCAIGRLESAGVACEDLRERAKGF